VKYFSNCGGSRASLAVCDESEVVAITAASAVTATEIAR
jgi:hypothetical protein